MSKILLRSFLFILCFFSVSSAYASEGLKYNSVNIKDESLLGKKIIKNNKFFDLPEDFEVHVISGLATMGENVNVNVRVDRPKKSVVLILYSEQKTKWNITSTFRTNIIKVIVNGYPKYEVNIDKKIPVEKNSRICRIINMDDQKLKSLRRFVKENLGKDKIDFIFPNVLGRFPNKILIDEVSNDERLLYDYPKVEKLPNEIEFYLRDRMDKKVKLLADGSNIKGKYYPPRVKVLDKEERYGFVLGEDSLFMKDKVKGIIKEFDIPEDFPKFSYVSGFDYYPEKKQVLVNTDRGGVFYKFDVLAMKWKNFIKRGVSDGIYGVAYDEYTKLFWGTNNFTTYPKLILYDDNLKIKKKINIKEKLKGYTESGLGTFISTLSFIFQKDYVIILSFKYYTEKEAPKNRFYEISKIWVMDRKTEKISLTYKKD